MQQIRESYSIRDGRNNQVTRFSSACFFIFNQNPRGRLFSFWAAAKGWRNEVLVRLPITKENENGREKNGRFWREKMCILRPVYCLQKENPRIYLTCASGNIRRLLFFVYW